MNSITSKAIINYLLGRIDLKKEDEFLANCFSTNENAEKFERVRDDLMERYLHKTLSSEDKEDFESHFLQDHHNRELFRFSQALRSNLKNNKQLKASALSKNEKKSFTFGNLLIPIGGLATLLIGFFIIWQFSFKDSGQEVAQTNPNPTPSIMPKPQISPKSSSSPNQTILPSPEPTVSLQATPTVNPRATPENPANKKAASHDNKPVAQPKIVLGFTLPLGPKGGGGKIMEITNKVGKIEIKTPKPKQEFPEYQVVIQQDGKSPLEIGNYKNFPTNEKGQIVIPVSPDKFETGNWRFIVIGKNADGTTQELRGTERIFTVKKEK